MDVSKHIIDEAKTLSEFHEELVSQLLIHSSMGMVVGAGEFTNAVKRAIFYGEPVERSKLIKNLKDLIWYISIACFDLNIPIEAICDNNFLHEVVKRTQKKKEKQLDLFSNE